MYKTDRSRYVHVIVYIYYLFINTTLDGNIINYCGRYKNYFYTRYVHYYIYSTIIFGNYHNVLFL